MACRHVDIADHVEPLIGERIVAIATSNDSVFEIDIVDARDGKTWTKVYPSQDDVDFGNI